jgi:hypothetical protein
MIRRILKMMNVIATVGEIGLYPEEKDVNETMLNSHPSKVRAAIIIIIEKSVSFL